MNKYIYKYIYIYIYIYTYIHIYQHFKNGKILAPQGLILKKQQSAKVEMFKAKVYILSCTSKYTS